MLTFHSRLAETRSFQSRTAFKMENYFQRIKSLPLHQQQVLNEKLRDWLAVEQGGAQNAASLAVFYVSRSDMSAAAVQAFLGARLPNYILPAEYVRVDALPKTIHGKIDRV